MSRVLVIGVGPHPEEGRGGVSGPTIRLRQFTDPLVAAGHTVSVVMLESAMRLAKELPGVRRAVAMPPESICDPKAVIEAVGAANAETVFGVGSLMPAAAAARVARLKELPVWIDFFGDPLAEWHGDTFCGSGTPDLVAHDHIWKFVRESLLAGDRFSTVSERQRAAVIGQLLLLGRIRAAGALHERVVTIPCGVPSSWTEAANDPPFPESLVRRRLSAGSRYLFVGGSWTSWLDVGAMGRGLRALLAEDAAVHVVVRGGSTEGVGGAVRRAFEEALGSDRDVGRIHFLEPDEGREDDLLAHAATALLLDRDIPESWLGSRNRLLALVRWGLCPVVSPRSEVALEASHAGLARKVAASDDAASVARALRESMAAVARDRERLRAKGRKFLSTLTFERTTIPGVAWASAPDRFPRIEGDGLLPRWAAFPAEPRRLFEDSPEPPPTAKPRRFWKR